MCKSLKKKGWVIRGTCDRVWFLPYSKVVQDYKNYLIEAILNTLVGFFISFLVSAILLPAVGIPVSLSQNLLISLVMTFVSVARGYVIRRYAQKNLNKFVKNFSSYFMKGKK